MSSHWKKNKYSTWGYFSENEKRPEEIKKDPKMEYILDNI